jgi:hypothetical protein
VTGRSAGLCAGSRSVHGPLSAATAPGPVVAVLRPFSTAERLGGELATRGLAGLAIEPAQRAAWGMTGPALDQAGWWRVVTEPSEPGDLVALLAGFGVTAVLAGDESAVPLAELVAAKLSLSGNDPATSVRRTDKIAMQLAVEAAGVPHPMTVEATTLPETLAAAEVIAAAGGPVVVKPRWSASSVQVMVCKDLGEVAAAWATIIGKPGALGEVTRVVAVQEHLAGTKEHPAKWTVDTVTVPGRDGRPVHVVTSVWRERVIEIGGHIAWGESWLVPPAAVAGDPAAADVVDYAAAVLDAAKVVAGPACTEVVLTARGPRLVEVMARLAGCYPVHLVELVTGQSQVTSAVDALTSPAALARRRPPRGDGRAVAQAWLLAPYDGFIDGPVLAKIKNLPSVVTASPDLVPGMPVRRTIDTPTSPGRLDLCGPPGQVKQAITTIRALEHDLYGRR